MSTTDENKAKYFRVQENHYAGASSKSAYTKAKVEELEKENKKRKRQETLQKQRKRHLVQRASPLVTPRASYIGLHAEAGQRASISRILQDGAEAFARSLDSKVLLDLEDPGSARNLYVDYRSDFHISHFDYDPATRGMVLGMSPNNDFNYDSVVSVLPECFPATKSNDDVEYGPENPVYTWSAVRPVSVFQSPLSSININPKTRTFVTASTGDRQPPTVQISQLVSPESAAPSQPLDSGISSLFRPPNLTTIFCTAINPWLSPDKEEHIAVGSGGGSGVNFFGAWVDSGMRSQNWRPLPAMKTYSDVLALDWLGPNLLAAGLRDASVMLYDIRAQQGIKRMRHHGGVVGLKRADVDERFVVAGMESMMALYDLRALRTIDAGNLTGWSSADKRTAKAKTRSLGFYRKQLSIMETEAMRIARPICMFEYQNDYDMLGMDVSSDLGIVAAAEEGGFLRLSNLRNAATIKRWKVSRKQDEKIRCVRFVEDERGVPKVVVSCGARIAEFSW
ncbi:hypothetical protein, variant [Verruconis gallopava]|uniref:DNA damage-binding protein CMR1 n=1 Tax=Verruconis gallopava TaxID=253628 RepID=A0A0D1ZX59_9PEZI|nr:hypothetical protein, variant [Verruconis gallopava]KIV98634.1 hypothetical protein, variant [Verruconis gallopava]